MTNENNFGKTDMIQANQLRIDNWVYNSTTKENMLVYPMMIAQLSRLEKDGGHSVNIHPIPLTEEILLKCGFERQEYNDYRHPVLIGTLTLYEGVAELHISDLYSVWVNNLHQLQNLYFALMGEELEEKIS